MQFKSSGRHQPKPQKLDKFNYRINELSRIFQHVRSSRQFVETWKKHIQPYLSSVSGVYRPPATSGENSNHSQDSPSMQSSSTSEEPRTKKQRLNCDEMSTDEMSTDEMVAKKYIGKQVMLIW